MQNALHVPAYTVLTILLLASVGSSWRRHAGLVAGLACVCILCGIVLELLQAHIPGRFASATDMFLNAAGVLIGLIAWRYVQAKLALNRPAPASDH